ncbi:cyclophilin-like fold protein [Bifidobacterium aemilianum]|uniref:cyclophilin-like fold protein n=1 Tax=Bifidobacterium aemilianum TaxID=2493120 RepID=UPI00191BE356|nr:cyclophilin-like fold protein [Bifidobacterium aemilianum]
MAHTITINSTSFKATVNESKAASNFMALLPLTLSLQEFNKTEKIAGLPKRLDTSGSPSETSAKAGVLAY